MTHFLKELKDTPQLELKLELKIEETEKLSLEQNMKDHTKILKTLHIINTKLVTSKQPSHILVKNTQEIISI